MPDNARQAAEMAARKDLTPAQQFARKVIEDVCFAGMDIDGGTLQEWAVSAGLLREEIADSGWFVFTAALQASGAASDPAGQSEAVLREALAPFAEQADELDDAQDDRDHLWESPQAMALTVGNLRCAKAALSAKPARARGEV